MGEGRSWEPLVDGKLADDCAEAIEDLASALTAPAPASVPLDGSAAQLLFYAYLQAARGVDCSERLTRHYEATVELVARGVLDEGLHSGFTGAAWVIEHVFGGDAHESEDDNAPIDAALLQRVAETPWTGDFELLRGLTGIGIYGLARSRHATGRAIVDGVVAQLDGLAERHGDGVAWLTRPSALPQEVRRSYPRGMYNLGSAHGQPSTILFLAAAARLGNGRARSLAGAAVRWLVAQRTHDGGSYFPAIISDGMAQPSRLAWCYGDAGVACALVAAGRAAGEPAWIETALLAGRCAARQALAADLRAVHVVDASLCHGSAGLALLLHRLWHETREPIFADAARRLYADVLGFRERGRGIGGFRARHPGDQWRDEASLLLGSSGIGLVLLAGTSTIEPAWDRLLAVSLP